MVDYSLYLLQVFVSLLGSLAVINLIIIFHELGHYYFAFRAGMIARSVSAGFGRLLIERIDAKGTRWQIRLWPFGGYVDLFGQSKSRLSQFYGLTYWQKSLILLGGILANLALAFVLFWGYLTIGYEYRHTIIGRVEIDSVAEQSGFRSGDKIVSINDSPIMTWTDVAFSLLSAKASGEPLRFVVARGDNQQSLSPIAPKFMSVSPDRTLLSTLGMSPRFEAWPAVIHSVKPNSPAADIGLIPGDEIVSIDHIPVESADKLIAFIHDHPNQSFQLSIKRKQNILNLSVSLKSSGLFHQSGYMGITVAPPKKNQVLYGYQRLDPLSALLGSMWMILQYLYVQCVVIYLLFSGVLTLGILGGPVIIIAQTYSLFSFNSLAYLLQWAAVINISLAFINLLPIPLLDGGRLLLLTIETLCGFRLSASAVSMIDRVTFSLLLGLAAMITYQDVARLLGSFS